MNGIGGISAPQPWDINSEPEEKHKVSVPELSEPYIRETFRKASPYRVVRKRSPSLGPVTVSRIHRRLQLHLDDENRDTREAQKTFSRCVTKGYVNYGEEEEMEIRGYRTSKARSALEWLGTALTLGLLCLVFHWYPHWRLLVTHVPCSLRDAPKILVVDRYQGKHCTYFIKNVKELCIKGRRKYSGAEKICERDSRIRIQLQTGDTREVMEMRVLRIKKLLYIWDDSHDTFIRLAGLDHGLTKAQLHSYTGYTEEEQELRRIAYGWNDISVKVEPILKLLILEVLTPFYIFQFFTFCVWFAHHYYYYLIAVVLMSVFGIASSIIQIRKNQKSLRDKVCTSDVIEVFRGAQGKYEEIPTSCLVPGDIVVLPSNGCNMQCDAALLNGSCVVNESMLTGESVPVNKTALPKLEGIFYKPREDMNHTIFCGTRVIQAQAHGAEHVHAVVLRTGFLTAKGALVCSILHPPPADFHFDRESYLFLGFLTIIALAGLIYTVVLKVGRQIQAGDIAVKALDLITIVIPPALPAALTVGKMYAQNRLQSSGIQCINSHVINVAGSINCVCFDKTGTLTEDGMDVWGIAPVIGGKFQEAKWEPTKLEPTDDLQQAMATCHSLMFIDGALAGDPLDLKMFESTGWILVVPTATDKSRYSIPISAIVRSSQNGQEHELGIVHQFQFSSVLQRMSSITVLPEGLQMTVFCKGSPEMIISLSKPSTVPQDAFVTLSKYTQQGYRVLALGKKELIRKQEPIENMQREDVEKDLNFLGFVILENKLKEETTEVIHTLRDANIRVLMITGDNIDTAVSVAQECGIIAPNETTMCSTNFQKLYDIMLQETIEEKLALTGAKWKEIKSYYPEILPIIYSQGTVFARMSSDQKQQLVKELKDCGYFVAMCGDGANDCGALRAAHTGISLSEAEASVAAPFTAREPNIKCVVHIIRQCRAALSTSVGIFKFMIAYSITEFLSSILLYSVDSNLSDMQFLFIDICLVLNFAFFFGKTEAYTKKLSPEQPLARLLALQPIASLLLHLTVVSLIMVATFFLVRIFPWYHPFVYEDTTKYASYDNFAVYGVSLFQYIACAVAFSQGKPYRKEVYTNVWFLGSLIIMTLICTYQVMCPAQWTLRVLKYIDTPGYDFRWVILCMGIINFIFVVFVEKIIVNYLLKPKAYSSIIIDRFNSKSCLIENNPLDSQSAISAAPMKTGCTDKHTTSVNNGLDNVFPSVEPGT